MKRGQGRLIHLPDQCQLLFEVRTAAHEGGNPPYHTVPPIPKLPPKLLPIVCCHRPDMETPGLSLSITVKSARILDESSPLSSNFFHVSSTRNLCSNKPFFDLWWIAKYIMPIENAPCTNVLQPLGHIPVCPRQVSPIAKQSLLLGVDLVIPPPLENRFVS